MHTCVEGSKRQLPSWMMQKVGASHLSNSGNVVDTNCATENGDITAAKVRRKDHKRETSRRKSNLNAKCEVEGRRNLGQQNESSDNITQKKKRKGHRSRDRALRSATKKGEKLENLSHGSSDDVYPVQASGEDDMELTVEDLMAVAEQYVKDHENKERQETPSRQCELKWQLPAKTEAGTTLDSPHENKESSTSQREDLYYSAPTTGELIPASTSQTGHPAQDMLDVFLGPLLRKTIEKEEKSKSTLESFEITHELTRQSQNEPFGEEMVPIIKKKNTLKDKVAMFLD